jgi:hypothetical protein
MKKILSVIGGFFAGIWRWIKETAWVQPLLIVGIIFGIIFAIPSVVDGIRKIDERNNSAEKYYKQFQVSLAGAENSAADKLLDEIKDNSEGRSTTLQGQKFFLVFVQKDDACAACLDAREGFEYLAGDGKTLLDDSRKIELKTIFVDQELKKKNKEDWKKEDTVALDNYAETAFEAFLLRNADRFEEYAGDALNTHYYINDGITEAQIEDIESADVTRFQTTTMIQVDFTDSAAHPGVTNVFIGIQGAKKLDRAKYLADAWNYKGQFGPNYTA